MSAVTAVMTCTLLANIFGSGKTGQVEQGFEHPGLVGGVPTHGRGVEMDGLSGPFQPKPCWSSVSMQSHFPTVIRALGLFHYS